jgi:hypothetical protein
MTHLKEDKDAEPLRAGRLPHSGSRSQPSPVAPEGILSRGNGNEIQKEGRAEASINVD